MVAPPRLDRITVAEAADRYLASVAAQTLRGVLSTTTRRSYERDVLLLCAGLEMDARFVPPPAVGDRLRHDVGVAGAETRLDVARRVYAAMTDVLARPADHQVVVTHGFAATFVVAAWIGMPLEAAGHVAFPVPSGSITTLREDGYFHNRAVLRVGDVDHLTEAHAPRP